MVRLLLWVALIAAAVYFFKRMGKKPEPRKGAQPPEAVAAPMVRCAHCGVHLPRDRALSLQQQWYCTQAHLEQGPGSRDR
ncbi:PP0621 family protein [Pseudomonas sp. NA-150]|uniref:PP0621 family protein n=1 Tax=Pseudomonas sp. NA-150 TaxID=3367525 RepID=UPI0037C5A3FA